MLPRGGRDGISSGADTAPWDSGLWAQRLAAIGLREGNIERLLRALETADLSRQEQLSGPVATPDGLRRLRAIGVLERHGTQDARAALAGLADAPVHPRESRAARAAADRLSRR